MTKMLKPLGVGDTVMLKGGNQRSTVTKVEETNDGVRYVTHEWHNTEGELQMACHPADALMKAPPEVNRGPPGGTRAAARRGQVIPRK
jgi:hypothetical protein